MKKTALLLACTLLLAITACKKDVTPVYEITDVNLQQPGSLKDHVKSTLEFISIAYSDLFDKTITNAELVNLAVTYSAFGDKKLIEDLIIRNFLNNGAHIPTKTEMDADVDGFVQGAYRKLFNRDASNYEKWYLKDLITGDPLVTPEMIYYSMMTSNEYRYY
ncbi:MAG: hypothetical protein H6585_12810 [Flavobacteriales bacterium]|nr:hypothetical protein [Flavobacteriales bacterium]MCB9449212.1 hypothetical protein [Flavobacteriales bacterium]